ncbi:helix-turn-helix domain-containing protein [Donghicola sp. C2-DW-16]|uniref:Helix-turn-helix domain-containing protein n=1 Tax=Donghicola mangrovi TaxID=2729614 RepID=A0A850Q8Y0_9RHOB|nr:helix-turn-helix domain-containing protein [Donghicola mangrovi]NVO23428.1 helix-turn-helix domain-containing protein [Donghicola mangrovi]NVO27114.1 helix-turn-helix domain-containing protein [Donghicola mangrovi]
MADNWYSPEAATFGDRVAAAREKAGMSQIQLAKRLGIKLGTLQGWEEDTKEPRANKLQMMAGLLNVSIMWLLNGEGDGVEGPVEESNVPTAINDILAEMRDLKTQMTQGAERLARLEKKLRLTLKEIEQ